MAEKTLRIRLEFKNFKTSEMNTTRVCFVYKKQKNDCVKQLSQLIQQRFNIKHSISLFIDNFLLQNDETIEAVRDGDVIVVEPDSHDSQVKSNNETKPKSVSTAIKTEKTDKPKDNKSLTGKRRQNKSIDSLPSCVDSVDIIHSSKKQKIESSSTLDGKSKSIDTNSQQTDASIKIKTEKKEESNELNDDSIDVYSTRNTPLRKAFKAATKCLSEREPVKAGNPSKVPKRKTLSREAREPVDKFSPIIPLKDLKSVQEYNHLFQDFDTVINGNKIRKKQSARKTFPTQPNNTNSIIKTPITATTPTTATITTTTTTTTVNSGYNINLNNVNNAASEEQTVNETIENESNSNDFSDCEPLAELPNVGDLIAFKLMTQSKITGFPEASKFQKGAVINRSSNMVDILIDNDNNKDINDTNIDIADRRVQILKINWSTILEPKIIQRQHLLLSDSS